MESLATLVTVAIFIESLISYGETVYNKGMIQWQIVVAMIISGIICYDTGVNFFTIFGLAEKFPVIGTVATATVLCRGSNYMFEFYNNLSTWRNQIAVGNVITGAAGAVTAGSTTTQEVVPDQTPEVQPIINEMIETLPPMTEEIEQEDVKAAKK